MCVYPRSFTYGTICCGHLAVGQRPAAALGHALPRTEVQLVHRQRAIEPAVLARPLLHPLPGRARCSDRDPRRWPRRSRRIRRTCRRDRSSAGARRRRASGSRTCSARRRRPSGTNVSQMPLTPRLRIGCEAGFQPLKSPMTLTCSALGAQTAKCTPALPSTSRRCAPSFSYARCSVPSLNRCRSYSVSTL